MARTARKDKDAGQNFIERLAAGCARARAGVDLAGEHIRMVRHRMPGLNRTVSTGTGSPVGGWPLGTTSIVHGQAGGGKLLRVDEPIPTPTGWILNGNIVAGDLVLTEKGAPCRVVAAHASEIPKKAYRIYFDDGSNIEAGAEHLWLTFDHGELDAITRKTPEWRARRRATRSPRRGSPRRVYAVTEPSSGSVRTTQEIFDTLFTSRGEVNHAIPVAESLDLPDVELPLDPYLLGAWLGDGTTSDGAITTADAPIHEAFAIHFKRGAVGHQRGNKASTYKFLGLKVVLRKIGVLNDKHIPISYLRASRTQRLALLQGLLDTDGTVAKSSGSAELCGTNQKLMRDANELICSLGWKVQLREGRAILNGIDYGPKWTLKWIPSCPTFRLERKATHLKLAKRRTTRFRYIVNCQPCIPTPMRCITVDNPTKLYLAGRQMVPTHNTSFLAATARSFQDARGIVYYVDAEFVLDLPWLWKLGVDPSRFALLGRHHEDVRAKADVRMADMYYEDVIREVDRTIDAYRSARLAGEDIGPMLIVVDSLAKLIPRSISQKIGSSKGDLKKATLGMVQAGYNTTWCADLGPKIADHNIAMVFIQHEAEGETEKWSGKTGVRIKGGRGILFDASVIASVSFNGRMYDAADGRAKGEEGPDTRVVTSKKHRCKVSKTKVGAQAYGPASEFEFFVSTGMGAAPLGFDRPRELVNEAARRGLLGLEWSMRAQPTLTLGTRVHGLGSGKSHTLAQMYERPELVAALEEVLGV